MNAEEAIFHLTADIKRYADSGRAKPKAIAFKEAVVNTLVDELNRLEAQTGRTAAKAKAKVAALEADVQSMRAQMTALAGGEELLRFYSSFFDGRAAKALQWLQDRLDHEEGRSIPETQAQRLRRVYGLLMEELEFLYDSLVPLSLELARQVNELKQLRTWCQVHGMDMAKWDALPQEWKDKHLDQAVQVANDQRLAMGITHPLGVRTGRAYAWPDDVAYDIISGIAMWNEYVDACRRLGHRPEGTPPWHWPFTPQPA